jgi:hypothetical protein
MSCGAIANSWAGIEYPGGGGDNVISPDETGPFLGRAVDNPLQCATDPFDDFDDDDFDDEFDDDFEEEWDEELPGDADQFEDDEEAENDDSGLPVEPEFEDED